MKRIIEQAVEDEWGLARRGLWLCLDELESHGDPPEMFRMWATLHFLPAGSPFCCGEPGCHLDLTEEGLNGVANHVRRHMGLTQEVRVDFAEGIAVVYHEGVKFKNCR